VSKKPEMRKHLTSLKKAIHSFQWPVFSVAWQTMTEAECEALCVWLESPEGCTFQQEIPGDSESLTWTCDGTLKLTRHWMRAHGINEAATLPELEERGG